MPIQVPSTALNSAMTSVAVAEPMDFCAEDLGGCCNNGDRESTDTNNDQVAINPTLDLEVYANNYKGLAKINRLLFIADHCPPCRNDALQIALTYVQQNTLNWAVYQKIHQKMIQNGGNNHTWTNCIGSSGTSQSRKLVGSQVKSRFSGAPDVASDAQRSGTVNNGVSLQYDQTWVDQTMKKGVMKTEKLDTDLKHYKSNSIKESIRRGQDDLGEHYLDMGDVINALKCFSRARDYCTTNKHITQMCFNVIKVSAYASNWALVTTYVNRAEATPELSQPQNGKEAVTGRNQALTKLKCAAGVAELANRKYKAAAKLFLQAQFDYLNYPELVSPNNVAIYGSLCALASFDRQDLQKLVIANASFKQFLEAEPQLNDIIMKFYESKYAVCLKLLDDMKDNLLLDMYLAPHVKGLYGMIRNRGLIQYFSPYLSADLSRMARSFNTNVTSLEDELTKLILDNQIKARIDSHNKILYAKDVDQRAQTYVHALNVGKSTQQRSRVVLLRAAIHRAGIVVKAPPRGDSTNPLNVAMTSDVTVTPTNSGPSSPS